MLRMIKKWYCFIFLTLLITSCKVENQKKIHLGNFYQINIQKGDSVYFYGMKPSENKWVLEKNKTFYYPERKNLINFEFAKIAVEKDDSLKFYSFTKKKSWVAKNIAFKIPENDSFQSVDAHTIAFFKDNTLFFYIYDSSDLWIKSTEKQFSFQKEEKVLVFDDTTLGVLKNDEVTVYEFENKNWSKSNRFSKIKIPKESKIVSFGLLYIATLNTNNKIDLYIANPFTLQWTVEKDITLN